MKKTWLIFAVALLCSASAVAGMSHKLFKSPPAQVFAATVRVAQHGHDVVVDTKGQTVTFSTGSSGAYLGVNRLTVFFSGLPDGCGAANPCAETQVQVKCVRVTPDTMGFRLCNGDVNRFFGRLKKELKKAPASAPNKPPQANDHV